MGKELTDFSGNPPSREDVLKIILTLRKKVGRDTYVRYLGQELLLEGPNIQRLRIIFRLRQPGAGSFRDDVKTLLQNLGFECLDWEHQKKGGMEGMSNEDLQRILAFLDADCHSVWKNNRNFYTQDYADGKFGGEYPVLLREIRDALDLPA